MIKYYISSLAILTLDIINQKYYSLAFLTIYIESNQYTSLPALLNIGAKINLLPLSYYSQNQLAYSSLKNITSIVYNREALSLIRVTKD